jgi:hypothetical protein
MKTAAQIRQHRDDMREALITPCNCTGVHAQACKSGARILCACVELLNWVLDENPEYERVVKRLHQ